MARKPRPLPAALTAHDEFGDVADADRRQMSQRLDYVREIAANIAQWLSARDEPLRVFLEDVELDLTVCVNIGGGERSTLTVWLLHNSHAGGFAGAGMRRHLSDRQIAALDRTLPTDSGIAAIEAWLVALASDLEESLDRFFAARTYAEAMAHHIALDSIVAAAAGVVAKLHLNASVERR